MYVPTVSPLAGNSSSLGDDSGSVMVAGSMKNSSLQSSNRPWSIQADDCWYMTLWHTWRSLLGKELYLLCMFKCQTTTKSIQLAKPLWSNVTEDSKVAISIVTKCAYLRTYLTWSLSRCSSLSYLPDQVQNTQTHTNTYCMVKKTFGGKKCGKFPLLKNWRVK